MGDVKIIKQCEDCEGTGETEGSNCCGAPFWAETDICSDCKEHADDTCDTCEGTGVVKTTKK